MQILVINGSPRKDGNTSRLMDLIVKSAAEARPDVTVRRFDLNDLWFKGCQGCMGCKQESAPGCVQVDNLTPVLQAMLDSDAWLVGTPIYMGMMTGQLKMCVDRLYGFMGPNRKNRIPPGKRAIVAVTQGMEDAAQYKSIIDMLSHMLARRGLQAEAIVAGGATSTPLSAFSQEVQDRANAAGKWLVAG